MPWGTRAPTEIDAIGIIAALRMAGTRALAGLPVVPDLVILDGNHDWLTAPRTGRAARLRRAGERRRVPAVPASPPVTTMVKADLRCSSVAAASVLAKVERDALMVGLAGEHPAYRWEVNKGYAAPEHLAALEALGPCELHRRSWRLRGMVEQVGEKEGDVSVMPGFGVLTDEL